MFVEFVHQSDYLLLLLFRYRRFATQGSQLFHYGLYFLKRLLVNYAILNLLIIHLLEIGHVADERLVEFEDVAFWETVLYHQ